MTKTIVAEKVESKSVRFDAENREQEPIEPRRSRRLQLLSPEVRLDPLTLPVEGANELLSREAQETNRSRLKQRKWPWNRSSNKDNNSKDQIKREPSENRGTQSDPETVKETGATKKSGFGRGRSTSFTSQSSQSSPSPSRERADWKYKSWGPSSTEGAEGRKTSGPLVKPLRPPPPEWTNYSSAPIKNTQARIMETPKGEDLPPPYPPPSNNARLGPPPSRPTVDPFGALNASFRHIPTIQPIRNNPYDELNATLRSMAEHPDMVSLNNKSSEGDKTLTPSQAESESAPIEDSSQLQNSLGPQDSWGVPEPPETMAEFAAALSNQDHRMSSPPEESAKASHNANREETAPEQDGLANQAKGTASLIPSRSGPSGVGINATQYFTPQGAMNKQGRGQNSFHTVNSHQPIGHGGGQNRNLGIFDQEDFDETAYGGEYSRTYVAGGRADQVSRLNECRAPKCTNLVEGWNRLCNPCQHLERESASYTGQNGAATSNAGAGNTAPLNGAGRTPKSLSDMRIKIAHAKDLSRKSLDNVSAQRSGIVIQEIDYFTRVLELLGGPDPAENRMQRRLALFNLRAGDSSQWVAEMGLGEAVDLLDTIQPVSALDWVVSFHRAIGRRKIPPRPLDHHSWGMLRDEVLQAWFDRFLILKRVLEDPVFTRWKEGQQTNRGPYYVAKLPNIDTRVSVLLHHLDVIESLLMGFRTQPGIRGPSQQWIGRIGVHPPTNLRTEDNIAPSLLWNMRILEDCCYAKKWANEDFDQDAGNLFNLKVILESTLQGFISVLLLFQDKKNSDIRNFLNIFIMEVDALTQSGQPKPSTWKDFNQSLDRWISEECMESMLVQLDEWCIELQRTEDFRDARRPEALEDGKNHPPRGSVGTDGRYRKEASEPEYITSHPSSAFVATISKALTPFRGRATTRAQDEERQGRTPSRSRENTSSGDKERRRSTSNQRWGGYDRGRRDGQDGSRNPGGGDPGGPPGPPGGSDSDEDEGDGRKRRPRRTKCQTCGGEDHKTGDPKCPQRQKFCYLCQSTAHDYEDCNWRKDAPPCPHCGGYPHNSPNDCPRKQQDELRKKEDEFRESQQDGKMQYANYKARLELGANIAGEYLKNQELPLSEIGNKLRKQQQEEERRRREEMKLTQINYERSHYAAAKASIEAAEAEEILSSRHLANLKPGEELSARQKESIAKHGDVVFTQHYQGLTRTSAVPQKEMSLEQRGFGPEVVFTGDPRGLDVKEFFRKFEEAKKDRNWDEGACATVIAQRLKGPAKIWYENFRLDPKTHTKSMFYIELKAALLLRFGRKRDWFDKNRLFRDIRWDNYKYKGSVLSLWEEIKTRSFLYTEEWDETKLFTPAELRKFIATQHFFAVAPHEMVRILLDKGVEDDPDAMEAEMKRQESNTSRMGLTRRSDFPRDRLRISAIENEDEDDRNALQRYWDEQEELEVEALKKKDGDGSNEGEDTKTCWHCNRPGHVRQNCPELKKADRDKNRRPGDDGRFRADEVPGFESEAVKKNWLGPPKTAAVGRTRPQTPQRSQGSARPNRKPRSRFTQIIRPRGSTKPTRIRRDRTYRSRRTRNTYKVASLGSLFAGEDEEVIGRLERLLIAGENGEDADEEDEDDLQVIYNPSEVAELSRHTVDDPPEEADPPEVAGMEEAPPMSLSETEGGYLFGTLGSGDTGERFVPFRY